MKIPKKKLWQAWAGPALLYASYIIVQAKFEE